MKPEWNESWSKLIIGKGPALIAHVDKSTTRGGRNDSAPTSSALRKNRSASGYAPLAAASLGLLTYGGILARIPLRPNSATQLTCRSSALRPVPSASAQCRRVPKCRERTLPDRPRLALLPRPGRVICACCNQAKQQTDNPSARAWWFSKIQPLYAAGIAGFWTDLGEPEQDTTAPTTSPVGYWESEIHNVYSLPWHQGLAKGFASNYPNARLYILSRSGFAGDQRFGAGRWTNDTYPNWATLAAHPTALCNYGLSGLSYFGSDIGGFDAPQPTDELYVRWFQFGSFCPIFRAHGVDTKPTAPYQFGLLVQDHCRNAMKLRYLLLPYAYTAARETFATRGCRCAAPCRWRSRATRMSFRTATNSCSDQTSWFPPSSRKESSRNPRICPRETGSTCGAVNH